MIIVEKMKLNEITMQAVVDLYADSKAEVNNGDPIVGLPSGYTIAAGSSVFTSDQDIAFMKSDGTWNWG